MPAFILTALLIGIHLAAFFLPILAKILIHFDYILVLFAVWIFIFGIGGHNEHALLVNHEVHTVFTILIYLAAIGIWFGLQSIRVFNIYIFRIIGCALSAFILTWAVSSGLLGQGIADGMDTIWQWTVGILYFALAVGLRAKGSSLMREEQTN